MQEEGEAFYFIANYHSLTSLNDGKQLYQNTIDVTLDYLALGLDPEKATFFAQSDVPQVTENEEEITKKQQETTTSIMQNIFPAN